MIENPEKQRDFGWRYFHFIDKAGSRINLVEHKTDIFGLEAKPYMTMVAKAPDTEPVRFKGEPNVVWERGVGNQSGKFDFVFDNARFNGEITDTLEHKELKDVVLYEDKLRRKSHWAVDIPYGKITGELRTPQGEKEITGYVYQDRQWGNILIQEWVKNWIWTHLANENLFVVIFCINATNGQKSWHSISSLGQNVSVDHDFEVPHFPKLANSSNPDANIFQAEIKIPGKLSTVFTLSPQNVMRSRIGEKHPGFSASYVRWSVDGITNQSEETAQGVAEYMSIQKL
ncbi:MAG: hypothetical protein ACD_13C00248G0022 [uncultured bacterium]|uniref:AttH domain-containing protein n=1 Tax=Candidatus Woesebacteria bacterium GW2011_GWA1_40_43 TaxID=1618553 RepID=A0A0G0SN19_9BACT|nr:MAG: hypothetical protein ACD_13C00248G0022 [uncultured bacterium]KKR50967.1 MAG: hypothetical protein UT88_C0041G0003 [Candidatus Woesebacteria bacterium GW2011_GWD2_40_19]KKR56742.1 MAG: hypothetical protein UT96_C0035G0004 [Candidatus Woesebacteria bacterium GW2011_GWC2_40_30]KKR63806.1 MAG: hypothetical protein UU02_C0018G0003 [Candidatus Woesebacteria bacterium GW2011_GWA1_40_43]HAU65273.1 hypothetical protein [Candidatus Woesebacteria bacterium]